MSSLEILCPLGHAVEVPPENIGQRLSCPTCQIVFTISPGKAMPKLEIYCRQQHLLQVKQKYVGKKVRCPSCQDTVRVNTEALVRANDPPRPARSGAVKPILLSQPSALPVANLLPPDGDSRLGESAFSEAILEAVVLEEEAVEPKPEPPAPKPKQKLPKPETPKSLPRKEEQRLARDEQDALATTDTGLNLSLLGSCGVLAVLGSSAVFSFILLLIMQGVSTLEGFNVVGSVSSVFGWIFLVAYILSGLAFLVGGIVSLAVPWQSEAKIWAILQTVVTLCVMGGLVGLWIWERSRAVAPVDIVGGEGVSVRTQVVLTILGHHAGSFLAWGSWVMLLWQLARFAHKPRLVTQAIYLLLAGLSFLVLLLVVLFLPALGGFNSWNRAGFWIYQSVALLLQLSGSIGLLIWQIGVCGRIRSAASRMK
jgi:hypothetical protein